MTDPTGLDYHEAFKAMYPGLVAEGIKLHTVQDAVLKVVDRAARLRRAERERVKAEALALLQRIDPVEVALSGMDHVVVEMNKLMEEIR